MEKRWILHDKGCEDRTELNIQVPFQPQDWFSAWFQVGIGNNLACSGNLMTYNLFWQGAAGQQ